jgi:hypothetical protein
MSAFERTMNVVQSRLESRLRTGFRKIRVDGSHKNGKTVFCFTIFDNNNYTMKFLELKNLRMWKNEGDISVENTHMDQLLSNIVNKSLSEFVD